MKKTCKDCGKSKDISLFFANKRMKDGHLSDCKVCFQKKVLQWQRKNRDKTSEYIRKWRIANMEKYKAHYTVNNAKQQGRLKKQPCSICGNRKAEAHHEDYSKPLELIWLCDNHHRAIHLK